MEKTVAGLIPDTDYGIQVRAVNGPNISAWSPRFDFTTANSDNAPPAVQNVTIVVVADSFHIEWDRMGSNPNNGNSPIVRYQLELIGNTYYPNKVMPVLQGSSARLAHTLTFDDNVAWFNGIPRARVQVRIQAVDANGNLGDWSDQVEATNPPPGPVENLTAVGITDGVQLEWTPPSENDLVGYRVYGETSSNVFVPSGANLRTQTPSLSYFFETDVDAMWYFVVVAVDKFLSESIILVRAQARPVSRFTFDTEAPPVPEDVAGVITTDPVTLVTKMNVTWTYDVPPDDLSEFQFRIRPVGDTAWETYTLGVTADDFPLEFILEGLLPYFDYELQARARDFIGNASDWTLTVTVAQADNLAPSKPDLPTAVGNTQHIQVVHNGMNFEGYPLEEDVAFLEVYANTTNAAMTYPTDFAKMIGTIAFGPGMVQTFNIPAAASSGGTQQWYIAVLAVDRKGLRSPMTANVAVAVGLIDTLNVSDAAITNAKIFDLQVQKLTAGTGIIADLTVKSELTMGDATHTGYIKSYDWVSGSTGWRIGKGLFEVNDGVIKAGALLIQDSAQNIMPLAYSDFQWLDYYYVSDAINSRGQNGVYLTAGVADAQALNSVFNNRHLKIYSTSNTQLIEAWFTPQAAGATGYNIDVEEGAQYIVSGYFKNVSASACTWQFNVKGDVSGTPTLLVNNSLSLAASQTTYTRYQQLFTVPTGCNKILVGVKNTQADRAKDLRLDGFQVERVISGKLTAGPWKPPGFTTIEGGGITTGFLRSFANISVNGVDQPMWSLDISGIANFGDARVRGRIVVGTDAGTETDSHIKSGNYDSTPGVGWKIDGVGNAEFAQITSRHSSGSELVIGVSPDATTSGLAIYPPSGVVISDPTEFKTRWYTHADFGQGAEVQIIAPKRHDWGGTPSHIYLGAYSSTTTTDIDMYATHFFLKSIQFKFADNSGNRVEFKHSPTVGGYDDGFAFVGASGKKIVFDFNASNNKIISMDGSSNRQVLYLNTEFAMIDASDVTSGWSSSLYVGPVNSHLALHTGASGDATSVALYWGLDDGGFGSLKATNFAGTVNRKFAAQEFTVVSDANMKKNAKPVTGALAAVKAMPVYDYDFNMGTTSTASAKKKDLVKGRGILAQDVQAVLPTAVTVDPDSGTLSVQMYALLSTTMAALQETSARLEALEAIAKTQNKPK